MMLKLYRYFSFVLWFAAMPLLLCSLISGSAIADDIEIYKHNCSTEHRYRFIFFVDNSGSMNDEEFSQSRSTINATIDHVLSSDLNDVQVAIVQYGSSGGGTHTYDVSVPFTKERGLAVNWGRAFGPGGNVNKYYSQDHQPASLAKMREDKVYGPGGALDITDGTNVQFIVFSDGFRDIAKVGCCTSLVAGERTFLASNVKPGYGEYDDLKNGSVLPNGIKAQFTVLHKPPNVRAKLAGAAIASPGGSYHGELEDNPTDPDGSGILPRRYQEGSLRSTDTTSMLVLVENVVTSLKQAGTIAAPSVSVSAFNDSRHQNELYYSVFQPYHTPRWDGNVKKYRIRDGVLVDADNTPLIENGLIAENTRSLWSAEIDGNTVAAGGMAAKQPAVRNWWIDHPKNRANEIAVEQVHPDSFIDAELFAADDQQQAAQIQQWALGGELHEDTSIVPHHYVADSLHTSPLLLRYWARAADEQRNEVLYISNNLGVLHAVDAETGDELWSYSPTELLPNFKLYWENSQALPVPVDAPVDVEDTALTTPEADAPHVYGLDGKLVAYTKYKESPQRDYEIDTAYLYLTQRRGGNNIIAIDVSNGNTPENPFKVLWKIKGGQSREPFQDLAQTWSTPQIVPITVGCPENCHIKDTLLFSGGYNPLYDDKQITYPVTPPDQGHGNAIYLVDPKSGELLWSAGRGNHHKVNIDVRDSIPATPIPIDTDGNESINILFFSDISGHIWRIDIDPNAKDFSTLALGAGMIADLNPSGHSLRFFNRLDIALSGVSMDSAQFNIVTGTGLRSNPLHNENDANRIFVIRDKWVLRPPEGENKDPTTGNYQPDYRYVLDGNYRSVITTSQLTAYERLETIKIDDHGFYKVLKNNGEKVLQPTTIHLGRVFLTSYIPPKIDENKNGGKQCEFSLGTSQLSIFDLQTGTNRLPPSLGDTYPVGIGIVPTGTILALDDNGFDYIAGLNVIKLSTLTGSTKEVYRKMQGGGWEELDPVDY